MHVLPPKYLSRQPVNLPQPDPVDMDKAAIQSSAFYFSSLLSPVLTNHKCFVCTTIKSPGASVSIFCYRAFQPACLFMTATECFREEMPLGWNDALLTLRSESAQTPRNNSFLCLPTCLNSFFFIIIIISIAKTAREGEAEGHLEHKDMK